LVPHTAMTATASSACRSETLSVRGIIARRPYEAR
jgi:hypothetical protein